MLLKMDSEDTTFRKKREQSVNWAKNHLQQQNSTGQINWIILIVSIVILICFIYWYANKYSIRKIVKPGTNTIGYLKQTSALPSYSESTKTHPLYADEIGISQDKV